MYVTKCCRRIRNHFGNEGPVGDVAGIGLDGFCIMADETLL